MAAITETTIGPLQEELADSDPCVFVIEYCDGFKANLLGLGSWSVPRNIDDGQCAATQPPVLSRSHMAFSRRATCRACATFPLQTPSLRSLRSLRNFAPQTSS